MMRPVDPVSAAKFHPDGRPRPYPGITVSAPLRRNPVLLAALHRLCATLRHLPGASAFSFLPPSCWHMTVMRGVNLRRRHDAWPCGLARGASLPHLAARMQDRLRPVALPPALWLVVRGLELTGAGDIRLILQPEGRRRTARLDRLRDRLAQALHHKGPGLRGPLHLTLAYRVQPIHANDEALLTTALRDVQTGIVGADMAFGRPALIIYRDMWDFAQHHRAPDTRPQSLAKFARHAVR